MRLYSGGQTCERTSKKIEEPHASAAEKKETPKPTNYEKSEDWLKRRNQPRNNKGQFTSPNMNAGTDLNLSIISDDEFDCYNKSEGKQVQTNREDELQLVPKENNLTRSKVDLIRKIKKPTESVGRSNSLPSAKQTEKLCGVPYCTNKNKKKN